jgi:hypothetical protein
VTENATAQATALTVNLGQDIEQLGRQLEIPIAPLPNSGKARRKIELRDYQDEVIAAFDREVAAGRKSIALVAPTGAGKTVILSDIGRRAREQGRSVLVLAHRREIIAPRPTRSLPTTAFGPASFRPALIPGRLNGCRLHRSARYGPEHFGATPCCARTPICLSLMNVITRRRAPIGRSSNNIPTRSCWV